MIEFTDEQIEKAQFSIARKSFLEENFRKSYGWNGSVSVCYDCDNSCSNCPYTEDVDNLLRERATKKLAFGYISENLKDCPNCGGEVRVYKTRGYTAECSKCGVKSITIEEEDIRECAELLVKSFNFHSEELSKRALEGKE